MHYSSASTGYHNNAKYNRSEFRGLGIFKLNDNWDYFAGIGYRFVENDDRGIVTNTGYSAYLRQSTYYYIPMGVGYSFNQQNNWLFRSSFEYDFFIYGTQFSGIMGGIVNGQERGFGARVSLDATYPTKNIDYIIGGFIRHWHIDDSKVVLRTMEPENKTYEIGLKFGVAF